jgi:hypothetical protein
MILRANEIAPLSEYFYFLKLDMPKCPLLQNMAHQTVSLFSFFRSELTLLGFTKQKDPL